MNTQQILLSHPPRDKENNCEAARLFQSLVSLLDKLQDLTLRAAGEIKRYLC